MPYRITGTLKLPSGVVAAGVDIKFRAMKSFSPLIEQAEITVRTDAAGKYDVSLEFNTYVCEVTFSTNRPFNAGQFTVASDTVAGQDLPTLLQQAGWTPATPEWIVQIQTWLAEANEYASKAATSATNAKTSETNAASSASTASTKAAEASSSASSALSSKNAAKTSETNAATSATQASTSAGQASTSATQASTSAGQASTSASSAAQSQTAAKTSEANALDAANRAEQAAQTVVGALVDGGSYDPANGTLPTPVTSGSKKLSTIWKVTGNGIAGGIDLGIGDSLVYTSRDNSYYKIDNTESVSKVNNKTGVVTLTAQDVGADQAGTAAETQLPFPDLWLPLSNNLEMVSGYGTDVLTIGQDTLQIPGLNLANFERMGAAWYFNKSGILQQAAANEPRFEREGLLIEGQSTNLFRWDATRIATGGGVQSPVTSPSYQGITAKKIVGGTSYIAMGASKEILKDNTVYSATAIIDLKNSNIPNGKVHLQFAYSASWNSNNNIKVDIATLGVVATPGTTGTVKIIGDLLVITATATSSAAASTSGGGSIDLYYLDSSGATAAPPADGSICVVGFQLEERPFATSFILTSSSAATRAGDMCWMQVGKNAPVNADITIALEFDMLGGTVLDGDGASGWRSLGGFYTAGAGFYNWFFVREDKKLSYAWGREGDRATADTQGAGVAVGRVRNNLISVFSSGVKGRDVQGFINPKHDQTLYAIGNLAGGSGSSVSLQDRELWGHIRNLRIWHRALTDQQCISIK